MNTHGNCHDDGINGSTDSTDKGCNTNTINSNNGHNNNNNNGSIDEQNEMKMKMMKENVNKVMIWLL